MTHGLDARTHSNPRMVVVVSSTPIAVSSKPVAVASTPVAVAPTAVPVASKPGLGASAPVAGVEAAAAASTQAETVDPAREEPKIPVVTEKKRGRPFKVPDKRGRWRQMIKSQTIYEFL